jgi:hypothetical protein
MRFPESDREAVAARLRDAHADGRLTYQEFCKRLDDLYEATTYADLAPIVADLRRSGAAPSRSPVVGSTRPALRPPHRYGLLPVFVVLAVVWFLVVVGDGIVFPLIFWLLVLFVVMRIVRHRRRSSYR